LRQWKQSLRDAESLNDPIEYARQVCVVPDTGKPYRFTGYEYLRGPLGNLHPHVVVMKAAQLGWTVMACVRALWFVDVRRTSTLYLMPTEHDVDNFSAGRFAVLLDGSPRLKSLFTDVSNVSHKRAGVVNLYLRGSNSRSRLKSVPVGYLTIDEFDEMYEGPADVPGSSWSAVALARERLSGHRDKHELDISTPRVPATGIHVEFERSDARRFFIRCPACAKAQALEFPGNVRWRDRDPNSAAVVCRPCGRVIGPGSLRGAIAAGEWVAAHPGRDVQGYHVSQLYSPTVSVVELTRAWLGAQTSEYARQEFYNSKLGVPYLAEGAVVGPEQVARAIDSGRAMADHAQQATMGIDVGSRLHWEVAQWAGAEKCVLAAGVCESFAELARLVGQYRAHTFVIDANPERREARRLVQAFPGRGWLCFYTPTTQAVVRDDAAATVRADRTETLDAMLGRFRASPPAVRLPADVARDYGRHLGALVRHTIKDRRGEWVARYVSTGDDHFAHAANYNEIAHMLAGAPAAYHAAEPMSAGDFEW
jgi:phage terminase large subunit GpA